jgi:hypothetical protein
VIRRLLPHPASPSSAELWHIESLVGVNEKNLEVTYRIQGDRAQLEISGRQIAPHRSDDLWQETCCEVFLRRRNQANGYLEFNFAPSGNWAFYRLSGYRAELERPDVREPPFITTHFEAGEVSLEATIPWSIIMDHLPGDSPLEAGLSVILQEKSGGMAYWAVRHPAEKPDFHHPDSFFTL